MAAYEHPATSGSRLTEYLQNERKVSQESLDLLNQEHIDETTLPIMTEEELTKFLPLKGDRLAARQFCTSTGSRKTLIDRLREKFTKPDTEKKRGNRTGRGIGNDNAAKIKRNVEIGWMDYHKKTESYKQVRSQKGGGTRIVSFAKSDNVGSILEKGKSLFFPQGESMKGSVSEYSFKLCDFMQVELDDSTTLGELYSSCHMRTLRLYIFSKKYQLDSSENELPKMEVQSKKKARMVYSASKSTECDPHAKKHDHDKKSKLRKKRTKETLSCSDICYTESPDKKNEEDVNFFGKNNSDIVSTEKENSVGISLESNISFNDFDFHYEDSAVSFNIPWVGCEETVQLSQIGCSKGIPLSESKRSADAQESEHEIGTHGPALPAETQVSLSTAIKDGQHSDLHGQACVFDVTINQMQSCEDSICKALDVNGTMLFEDRNTEAICSFETTQSTDSLLDDSRYTDHTLPKARSLSDPLHRGPELDLSAVPTQPVLSLFAEQQWSRTILSNETERPAETMPHITVTSAESIVAVSRPSEPTLTESRVNEDVLFSDNPSNEDRRHLNSEASAAQGPIDSPQGKYSIEMNIHRGPLAFREVIGYFKDDSIMNKLLTINMILPNGEKEVAADTGGVLRDLLTDFWASFYDICTLGREAKVPSLRHDFGAIEWEAIARVLVYGYSFTGYWPVMLAKSFILQSIYPDKDVNNECLLKDFYSFVSVQDMEVFKGAFEDFSSVNTDDLLDSLDMYECKSVPCVDNIKSIVLEIAHTHIIQKPMFVCNSMRNVLNEVHLTKEKVDEIYERIIPSNRKVDRLLKFPGHMDIMEYEVSKHLKRYVRDLDQEKLKLFLRYCTGSDLLTLGKISVEFTVMNGLERRPIAHTCNCMLQLSKTYESYMEFRSEFDSVLSQNVWVMDIV